jgi:hypothetical protein
MGECDEILSFQVQFIPTTIRRFACGIRLPAIGSFMFVCVCINIAPLRSNTYVPILVRVPFRSPVLGSRVCCLHLDTSTVLAVPRSSSGTTRTVVLIKPFVKSWYWYGVRRRTHFS